MADGGHREARGRAVGHADVGRSEARDGLAELEIHGEGAGADWRRSWTRDREHRRRRVRRDREGSRAARIAHAVGRRSFRHGHGDVAARCRGDVALPPIQARGLDEVGQCAVGDGNIGRSEAGDGLAELEIDLERARTHRRGRWARDRQTGCGGVRQALGRGAIAVAEAVLHRVRRDRHGGRAARRGGDLHLPAIGTRRRLEAGFGAAGYGHVGVREARNRFAELEEDREDPRASGRGSGMGNHDLRPSRVRGDAEVGAGARVLQGILGGSARDIDRHRAALGRRDVGLPPVRAGGRREIG